MHRSSADHFIVAAAASDGTSESINADLEDRSGIVGHTANEGWIEHDLEFCCLDSVNTLDDRLQFFCDLLIQEAFQKFF